ncbi:hypothetical protein E2C05_31205, partial [Paracraurococcus ruber]|uniref:hypothetical protein n=1 Tax=Paracraurococcus ruber TaxID=77675 RepID=UPI00195FE87F
MITAAALSDPDAVRVLRLRLRGRPEAAAAVRMALAPLDPPPMPPGQVVLLRRLAAGPADAGLAARMRAEMARQVAAAVPADRADPARDAAVAFASAEALLARLLADLLDGRAAGCWWWDGVAGIVARPLPAAVAGVLAEAGLRLAGLAAALAAA